MSSNVPPSIQGVDPDASPNKLLDVKTPAHLSQIHLPTTLRNDSTAATQRIDPNAWGTDPCAPKNPPHHQVFTPAQLFKIARAPPVEAKGTGSFLSKLLSRDETWIVWHILSHDLEERREMPEDATEEKNQHLVVVFLLGHMGSLRQRTTCWGLDNNKTHIILTAEGWRYRRDIEEAAAIHVGEEFDFKRDEEKLKQTLVRVWEVDGGQCFKDAEY